MQLRLKAELCILPGPWRLSKQHITGLQGPTPSLMAVMEHADTHFAFLWRPPTVSPTLPGTQETGSSFPLFRRPLRIKDSFPTLKLGHMKMLGTQRLSELQMCSQAQPTLFFAHKELALDLQGLPWHPPQSCLIKGDKLGFGSSGVLTKHHAHRGLLENIKRLSSTQNAH